MKKINDMLKNTLKGLAGKYSFFEKFIPYEVHI